MRKSFYVCIILIVIIIIGFLLSGPSIEEDTHITTLPETTVQTFEPDALQEVEVKLSKVDHVFDWKTIANNMESPSFVSEYHKAYKDFIDGRIRRYQELCQLERNKAGTHAISFTDHARKRLAWWKALTVTQEDIKQRCERLANSRTYGLKALSKERPEVAEHLMRMLKGFMIAPASMSSRFNNVLIVGETGVGKSSAGEIIISFMHQAGWLTTKTVTNLSISNIGSMYSNGTELQLRNTLIEAMDGGLYAEEIYKFGGATAAFHDRKETTITTLVDWMDKLKGVTVIIGSGYPRETETEFLQANSGLPRRFNHVIKLQPPNLRTLCVILMTKLSKAGLTITKGQADIVYSYLKAYKDKYPNIYKDNGGSMENLAPLFFEAMAIHNKSWDIDTAFICNAALDQFAC